MRAVTPAVPETPPAPLPEAPRPIAPQPAPLVEIRGLAVNYPGAAALKDVSLTIHPGEIVTLVGPNGSGKTTLVRAVLGAVAASAGTIRRRPGLRIGYVPQKLALDPTLPLSVGRFLALPRAPGAAAIVAALARTGAGDLIHRPLAQLSGGQLQRVLLARALLAEPQLLVLDEPTQGLDQPGEAAFYRLIADLRAETHAAVLLVSHDLHVVMAASDRVICLNTHVCCEGTPSHVSAAPEYRALFGAGTGGALALYRHQHDHAHGPEGPAAQPDHGQHGHGHGHAHHEHAHPGPAAAASAAAGRARPEPPAETR